MDSNLKLRDWREFSRAKQRKTEAIHYYFRLSIQNCSIWLSPSSHSPFSHSPFSPSFQPTRRQTKINLDLVLELPVLITSLWYFLIRTFLWTPSSPALIDKQRQLLGSLPLVLFQEFAGNTNNYLQICHDLKNPIVTRYIRIIPLAWNVYIALRAGFYGCKSGKFRIYLIFLF